ncbi:exodeoxyribonuclease VII small subunit [candidate division KSB1 bacterium 4572_119]|nr:MAG: exodeoxyribonuclease VII small subunit [candidate division KSB1 bacterium 4572_119]
MAEKTFEQAIEELEGIVKELEEGELSLEKTIKKFERGMQLSKHCTEKLDQVEQKLKKLVKTDDGFQLEMM